jgi:hypothetical protein
MNIYFPSNFFSRVIAGQLPPYLQENISFMPASVITTKVMQDDLSLGLIPTTDLIQHNELFVSGKFGISFEGSFCNSYLYYKKDEKKLDTVHLHGDISSLEALFVKILFKEFYNTDIELKLAAGGSEALENNSLVVGDLNMKDSSLFMGISFAEEMIELVNLPFVNYVLASKGDDMIEEFHTYLSEINEEVDIQPALSGFKFQISEDMRNYIASSISSLVYKLDEQDIEGITQLLRLPYYYGIIKDILEIKFIK